jgi:hypothetical protein
MNPEQQYLRSVIIMATRGTRHEGSRLTNKEGDWNLVKASPKKTRTRGGGKRKQPPPPPPSSSSSDEEWEEDDADEEDEEQDEEDERNLPKKNLKPPHQ